MIGKKCVVTQWKGTHGKVLVGGELWHATSESPLIPGSETVIRDINNLTLMVASSKSNLNATTHPSQKHVRLVVKISFDLSPPPLVEDPDRFYRSGGK
jgi:hypothetical protein